MAASTKSPPKSPPKSSLIFPEDDRSPLEPYLPQVSTTAKEDGTSTVTLTFATSLDSQLSLAPGVQTILSGPRSKAMTHYLRSKHDAILIGVGTAVADDPGLNCRLEGVPLQDQPRPIVLDPRARWEFDENARVIRTAKDGMGKAPWIFTSGQIVDGVVERRADILRNVGGEYVSLISSQRKGKMAWIEIFRELKRRNVNSVMVEGGGNVINELISEENRGLIDSVIVTVAPTWLGKGGVVVSPERNSGDKDGLSIARLKNVKWCPLGEDVVLCGRFTQA